MKDINQLKLLGIFAHVVEQKSFAAAARKLNSSRSRISEQVASLETSLGVRLLQRSTRKLQLTNEGREIYQEATSLHHVLQKVEAIATPEEPAGRVAITLNHDIAHRFLLPCLPALQAKWPRLQLDLHLDDSLQDLITENIDLAIRIGFPKDSNLIARVIHEEAFQIFASPAFLRTFSVPKRLDDLEVLPWVLLSQTSASGVLRLKQGDQHLSLKPDSAHFVNSPFLLQKMVACGLGLGLLLPCTVKTEIENGELVRVLPELNSEPLIFSLVYPSRKQIPSRTQAVIDFLLETRLFG